MPNTKLKIIICYHIRSARAAQSTNSRIKRLCSIKTHQFPGVSQQTLHVSSRATNGAFTPAVELRLRSGCECCSRATPFRHTKTRLAVFRRSRAIFRDWRFATLIVSQPKSTLVSGPKPTFSCSDTERFSSCCSYASRVQAAEEETCLRNHAGDSLTLPSSTRDFPQAKPS